MFIKISLRTFRSAFVCLQQNAHQPVFGRKCYYVHYDLQVYHLAEGKEKSQRFFDEELEEHQPFPTLRQALDSLDPHVGFNIEIKWTMQLKVCLA
jgi:hypothetical protein